MRRPAPEQRPDYVKYVDHLVELYETEDMPWVGTLKHLAQGGNRDHPRAFLAYLKTLKMGA